MKTPNADLTTEHTACIPRHTPGPWHVGMKPGPIVYGPQGEQVVSLHTPMLDVEENKANARLVASAPELLAALESIKAVSHEFDVMPEVAMKMYEIARAAINAAKGEA